MNLRREVGGIVRSLRYDLLRRGIQPGRPAHRGVALAGLAFLVGVVAVVSYAIVLAVAGHMRAPEPPAAAPPGPGEVVNGAEGGPARGARSTPRASRGPAGTTPTPRGTTAPTSTPGARPSSGTGTPARPATAVPTLPGPQPTTPGTQPPESTPKPTASPSPTPTPSPSGSSPAPTTGPSTPGSPGSVAPRR